MESIAVTKPDMGLFSRHKMVLSPFGVLAQTFSEELLARAGFEEGRYPFVPLDFLEEGASAPPPAVVQPVLQLDLNLVLEALRRTENKTERERVTERIAERIIRKRETFRITDRPAAAPAAERGALRQSSHMEQPDPRQSVRAPGIQQAATARKSEGREGTVRAPGRPGEQQAAAARDREEREETVRAPGRPGEQQAAAARDREEREGTVRTPGRQGVQQAAAARDREEHEETDRAPGGPGVQQAAAARDRKEQKETDRAPRRPGAQQAATARDREEREETDRAPGRPGARQAAAARDRGERKETDHAPGRPDQTERPFSLLQNFYSTINQHIHFTANIQHMAAASAENGPACRWFVPGGLSRRTGEFSRQLRLLREEGRPTEIAAAGSRDGTGLAGPAAFTDLIAISPYSAAIPGRPDREGPETGARILAGGNLMRLSSEELAHLEQSGAVTAYEVPPARKIDGTLRENVERTVEQELAAEMNRSQAPGRRAGRQDPGRTEAVRQSTGPKTRRAPRSEFENTASAGPERKTAFHDGADTARAAGAAERAEPEEERSRRETGGLRSPVEARHHEAGEAIRDSRAPARPAQPRDEPSAGEKTADTAEMSYLETERPRQTGGALYSREERLLSSALRDIRLTDGGSGGVEFSAEESPREPALPSGAELAHRMRPDSLSTADAEGHKAVQNGPQQAADGRRTQFTTGTGAAARSGGERQAAPGREPKPPSQIIRSAPEPGGPPAQAAGRTRTIPLARDPLHQTADSRPAAVPSGTNGTTETRLTPSVRDIRTAGEGLHSLASETRAGSASGTVVGSMSETAAGPAAEGGAAAPLAAAWAPGEGLTYRSLSDQERTDRPADMPADAGSGRKAYAAAQTGTEIRQGPQTGADVRQRPQTGADVRQGPQTGADARQRPQTGADVRQGPQTGADARQRPQTSADVRQRPQTGADVRQRPQTGADARQRPQTSADVRQRPQTGTYIPQRPQGAAARDIRLIRGPQVSLFGRSYESESGAMAAGSLQAPPPEAVIYRTGEREPHAAVSVQAPGKAAQPARNRAGLSGTVRSATNLQNAAALEPRAWPGGRLADLTVQGVRARREDRVLSAERGGVSREAPEIPPAAPAAELPELIYSGGEQARSGQNAVWTTSARQAVLQQGEPPRTGREPEPLELELAYSGQRQTQDGPAAAAAPEGTQSREGSGFVRALPDWVERFLREGVPKSMTEATRQMGVVQRMSAPRSIAALPAFEQGETFEWTAPDYRPPAQIEYREKPRQEERSAAQNIYISDAEIRRTADRVYQIIEDRIRRERRRMGL